MRIPSHRQRGSCFLGAGKEVLSTATRGRSEVEEWFSQTCLPTLKLVVTANSPVSSWVVTGLQVVSYIQLSPLVLGIARSIWCTCDTPSWSLIRTCHNYSSSAHIPARAKLITTITTIPFTYHREMPHSVSRRDHSVCHLAAPRSHFQRAMG